MRHTFILFGFVLSAFLLGNVITTAAAPEASTDNKQATQYLLFQIFTYGGFSHPDAPAVFPPPMEIDNTVNDITNAIGNTGDKRHKLGFTPGPLTFDHTDKQIQDLIEESFRIAREKNVAVAFHLDDQIFWGARKDLLSDVDNVEWSNWNKTPNTGRRLEWSATPQKVSLQMCLNSSGIRSAVKERAGLIGRAIKKEVEALKREHKEELFAGVIAGWETMIARDFLTNRPLGYCALSHRGYSVENPPSDFDGELVKVVKEFMELWAKELAAAGVPKKKIYAHIAFTPQGFSSANSQLSFPQFVGFATPEVAFSHYYCPGFSTYPVPGTFEEIHAQLGQHGTPPWVSAEGTNVIPNGMPGEATMETYLGKMFNHGAIMVNIFSWGIGGEAERKTNFFRLATENPEALSAYRKFLHGEALQERERPANAFSPTAFQQKVQNIQKEVPPWVQRTRDRARMEPLMHKLDSLVKEGKFQEADKVANEILKLIGSK